MFQFQHFRHGFFFIRNNHVPFLVAKHRLRRQFARPQQFFQVFYKRG
jgi:hypothetical protein